MATDSLFILSVLTPVGSQSISRDLEWERKTEDKSSGERRRQRERKDSAERGDLFVLPVGLWPHTGRQMLMGSFRNLLCDYGARQLI